jgi:hypothetical protein
MYKLSQLSQEYFTGSVLPLGPLPEVPEVPEALSPILTANPAVTGHLSSMPIAALVVEFRGIG